MRELDLETEEKKKAAIQYASDQGPNEIYRNLHQRCRLKMTWTDRLKLLIGHKVMVNLCLRVIVTTDQDGKFKGIDTNTWSSQAVVIDNKADVDTLDARFSPENYQKLHK